MFSSDINTKIEEKILSRSLDAPINEAIPKYITINRQPSTVLQMLLIIMFKENDHVV